MRKLRRKRVVAIFLTIVLVIISCNLYGPLKIYATQSKNENFSKNYSLGNNPADNLVAVAQAQLGKTKAQLGYTEAWCADFVSDCAQLAGVGNIIPFDGYCQTLYTKVKNAGGQDVSSPQKGDLVFYYCSACSVHWCHVGIMLDSVRSIEGNYGGKVSNVNGAYRHDGHSLANGIVTRRFVRPAYGGSVSTCNCNESYKGNYTVIANTGLNIRSGHGMAYSIITTIPKGERVYVSKGNGSWAHVEWNGYSGYCAMEHLTKIEISAKNIKLHAWISDDKMGDVPENFKLGKTYYLCYEVLDSSTGKRFDDANYNYSINETLYNSDGSVIGNHKYENSNNNWIGYRAYTPGIYKGVVTISGDYDLKVEVSYELKSNKVEEIQIQDSNGNYRSNLVMKNIGDTVNLKAKIAPEDAEDKTITWTSTDPTVVSVDSNGKITAKKAGAAKITVTAKDGGVSDFCNVKVKTYGIVYGDCNEDGAVTATDLSAINQAANGIIKLSEEEKKVFDLNGDGVVDDEDVELLKQFVLGTRTSFPVEEQLSEIVISTMPKKTTYYIGDSISIQGITVKAYYNNGTSKIVNNLFIDGETLTVGKQTVTLSYTEAGITKSVSYSIYVKQKEFVEATILPMEKPIKTNIPTDVPEKTLKPTATIKVTPIPKPVETERVKSTAIPSWIVTGSAVTGGAVTIGTLEPIATSDASDFVTMQPTAIPILTAAPKETEDTTNGQNDTKDDVEEYDTYEVENVENIRISGKAYYNDAFQVLKLVNKEREKKGLSPLIMDEKLLSVAMRRAAEINVYFSHTRPDGSDCYTVIDADDLMSACGENIAAGQSSPRDVMNCWMNSSGHKANILNENYNVIGIGCFKAGDCYYWVQAFGQKSTVDKVSEGEYKDGQKSVMVSVDSSLVSIRMSIPKKRFKKGSVQKIQMKVTNKGFPQHSITLSNTQFTFSSSNKRVVKISSKGVVKGYKKGKAKITAKFKNSGKAVKKTITVTVK